MEITASQVMKLREATGLGMMLCKKALIETNGDMQQAVENLRKQGQVTAQKRAGKTAKEGTVTIRVGDAVALMYEVNSETDFVARNADFVSFVDELGTVLLSTRPQDMEAAMACTAQAFGGRSVAEMLTELIGKIGENISFRRFELMQFDPAKHRVFSYVHGSGKIGVLVKVQAGDQQALSSDAVAALGKDIAMQIAAANPMAVDRSSIPQDIVEKEKEIYHSQAQTSGRPENVWDKIVEGKLSRFYKESVLLEQEFIKETKMTVADRVKQAVQEAKSAVNIESFIRFERGSDK